MLDNEVTQPSKSKTKNWVEINDDPRATFNTNSQIKFETRMLKPSLYNYSYAYILIKGTKTAANTSATDVDVNNTYKKTKFKKCASLTDCIREIDKTQIDNAKSTDAVMLMYNLLEQNNNYSETSKTSGNFKIIPRSWSANCLAFI